MDRFEAGWLLDFYGPLLTSNRRQVLRLYLEEDMSLGEIAQETGVSRQSVHDALHKAHQQLMDYESKLGLMNRYRLMQQEVARCRDSLSRVQAAPGSEEALAEAARALGAIEVIEQK